MLKKKMLVQKNVPCPTSAHPTSPAASAFHLSKACPIFLQIFDCLSYQPQQHQQLLSVSIRPLSPYVHWQQNLTPGYDSIISDWATAVFHFPGQNNCWKLALLKVSPRISKWKPGNTYILSTLAVTCEEVNPNGWAPCFNLKENARRDEPVKRYGAPAFSYCQLKPCFSLIHSQ